MDTETREAFISIPRAATRLGVPIAWLRAETEAGRLPALHAGKRVLVNVEAVERALLERTQITGASR